jgi:hypothetical protein
VALRLKNGDGTAPKDGAGGACAKVAFNRLLRPTTD